MGSEGSWRKELELAGHGDLQGLTVNAVKVRGRWSRPSFIGISGDLLLWALDQPEPFPEAAERGLLAAFCAIKDEKGAARVAERFGPLGLCEHGYFRGGTDGGPGPTLNDGPTLLLDDGPQQLPGLDLRCCPDVQVVDGWAVGESLGAWLKYARWLRAALTVYARLQQHEPIPADEWREGVYEWGRSAPEKPPAERLEAFAFLAISLQPWLWNVSLAMMPTASREGIGVEVVPRPSWVDYVVDMPAFVSGFAPYLGLQLAALLSGRARQPAVCDGCGKLYTPRRQPRRSNRHFCGDCRRSPIPARLRRRDYLRRLRR